MFWPLGPGVSAIVYNMTTTRTYVDSGPTTLVAHITDDMARTLCGRKLYSDDFPISDAAMQNRKVCQKCAKKS